MTLKKISQYKITHFCNFYHKIPIKIKDNLKKLIFMNNKGIKLWIVILPTERFILD